MQHTLKELIEKKYEDGTYEYSEEMIKVFEEFLEEKLAIRDSLAKEWKVDEIDLFTILFNLKKLIGE